MQTTLVLDALLGLAVSSLYLAVWRITSRRAVTSADADKANRAFSRWWLLLALTSSVGAARQLLAGVGILDVTLHSTITYLTIPPLMVALAGLLQYLVYLHVGTLRWHAPILYAHLVLAATYVAIIAWLHPQGIAAEAWRVQVDYARPSPGWFTAFTLVTILGPVLAASGAYLAIAFRTRARIVRFRILTVTGAFVLWFGGAGLAAALGWSRPVDAGGWYWWPLAARALSLVATLLILFAYKPPSRLETRMRVEDEEDLVRDEDARPTGRLAHAMSVTSVA